MRPGRLALLLLLCACGADGTLLVGEWQWLETSGGITGETRANPDHLWRLRFDRDGTVHETYAGRPPASGAYDVEAAPGAAADDPFVLELSGENLVVGQDTPFEARVLADTMLLSATAADGVSYRFVRIE